VGYLPVTGIGYILGEMTINSGNRPKCEATVSCKPLRVVVAVNERGRRIGETHHNAHISQALVDEMRARHEEGGLGYRKISRELNVPLTTVRKICTYERRAQTPERWKTARSRKEVGITKK
jgi:hypothetical protein